MDFIKKNLSNIIFFAFIIFLFTPMGMPLRATLIKGVSYVTTRVFRIEIDKEERIRLENFDWILMDKNGEKVDFNTFKGEVVIVNFWATWCPPCVAEMPAFEKLYDDYKNEAVFLFVANDDPKKVDGFLSEKNYSHPVYYPFTAVPEELENTSLPTTYIIGRNGEIVVEKVGAADWNSGKVRHLIEELIQEKTIDL